MGEDGWVDGWMSLNVDNWNVGCSVSPQPLTAGAGDVVVLAAGVDGRLDFSLAALWGKTEETSVSGGVSVSRPQQHLLKTRS